MDNGGNNIGFDLSFYFSVVSIYFSFIRYDTVIRITCCETLFSHFSKKYWRNQWDTIPSSKNQVQRLVYVDKLTPIFT